MKLEFTIEEIRQFVDKGYTSVAARFVKSMLQHYDEEKAVAEAEKTKPCRCPVCDGRGHVPSDFYNVYGNALTGIAEVCRTCRGQGIVWNITK